MKLNNKKQIEKKYLYSTISIIVNMMALVIVTSLY